MQSCQPCKDFVVLQLKVYFCLQLRERPLIQKFYEDGKKFLTIFPDGSGNVLYPFFVNTVYIYM